MIQPEAEAIGLVVRRRLSGELVDTDGSPREQRLVGYAARGEARLGKPRPPRRGLGVGRRVSSVESGMDGQASQERTASLRYCAVEPNLRVWRPSGSKRKGVGAAATVQREWAASSSCKSSLA